MGECLPELIAHRGHAYRYPENTLASLQAAVEAGAKYVEFDVQLTADGEPVVLHDAGLERVAGDAGAGLCVHEMAGAQVCGLSVHEPGRLGAAFDGVQVPGLLEACRVVAGAEGVTGFVELKEESIERFGAEQVVQSVMGVLGGEGVLGRFVVISFDLDTVLLARKAGWERVGWVLHRWDQASRVRAEAGRPEYLFCNVKKVPDVDRPFWAGDWRWAVYEVSDAAGAIGWGRRGADMVETFRIGEVMADPAWVAGGSGGAGV